MDQNDVHCATCRCSLLPNTSSDTLNHRIDQRIQALRQELQFLSTYRNALAPIHKRLPDEILLTIFHTVLTLDFAGASTFLTLTRITSVCTHWRIIAIKDPSLWTRILYVTSANPIKCMFERSNSLPLFIKLELPWVYCFHLQLSSVAERLQRLEFTTDYHSGVVDIMEQLKAVDEWPVLEHMLLESHHTAPQETLICNAPRLSAVYLLNIKFQHLSNYPRGLRHFRAHYMAVTEVDSKLSLIQWLDFLSAVPNLETLDLCYPLSDGIEDALNFAEHVVYLASLREFVFCEMVVNGAMFLHHLEIPSEATIDITFRTGPETALETELGLVSPVIEHLIKSHNILAPLRSLTLHLPGSYNPNEVYLGFSFSSVSDPLWLLKTSMSFKFAYRQYDDDVDSHLRKIITGMRPAVSSCPFTELAIECTPQPTLHALQQYDWMRTLTFFGALGPWYLEEILEMEREVRVNALLNIRILILHGIPFHWIGRHKLLEILEGTGIRTVKIEMSTGVLQEDVDAIREKVDVVAWDGDTSDLMDSFSALSAD